MLAQNLRDLIPVLLPSQDVAAVGFGKKELLIKNRAKSGDRVVLLGGPTGRDGMGGAQFASDRLESEDRSAVQIPDPFIEKMIIEAVLEARREGLLHAVKDLGGGGLSSQRCTRGAQRCYHMR